ncbi:MAG: hypothetical protein LBD97_03490, partial [Bifidobacteriaceae bacterium]|nr:hypothetical protein [Bifidobacteriaceae bacterium]
MPDLPTAVLLTRDPELATLAKACVWEAGVAVRHLEWPDQLDALAPTWSLVVCGRDVGADVPQAVKRAWPASTVARVALGAAGG